MTRSLSRRFIRVRTLLLALACSTLLVAAGPAPDAVKPSEYAPAADLIRQLNDLMGEMERDLESEENYGEYQQGRVEKDANTVAAIALVLGKHDQPNELKAAAPAIIEASVELAVNASDYAEAQAALEKLQESLKAQSDEELEWEPVADLAQLMKQVPIVNNDLRRGVTGRRFDRSIDKSAAQAAALAAIAQASMVDTTYCSDEEDAAEWAKICADMRDACAKVHAAVRAKDQKTATEALDAVVATCDACHHKFRD